jgi:endonuclease/exonuclease/phosphatase family metal-dependent hydrolase
MIIDYGFSDVTSVSRLAASYTYRSDNPFTRFDYILVSPGLSASEVVIPASTASDHLSIVATVE